MSTNMPPSSVNSHFYHIPKTGGRSIISAFGEFNYPNMNLSTEDMYGFIVDTIKSCGTTDSSSLYIDGFNGITFGSKFLTFGHIPYHKVFSVIESHENRTSYWKNKGVSISSTKIRNYISQGELKLANSFLALYIFYRLK